MNKAGLIRVLVCAALLVVLAAPMAYAPAFEHIFYYYSDSSFTTEVGEEGIPGPCESDSYWYCGDVTTYYRRIVWYDGCGWQIPMQGTYCYYYDPGDSTWHLTSCS
jgi:hypothetical protein